MSGAAEITRELDAMVVPGKRPLVVYALYSGKLYGTERMALATLGGLRHDHDVLLLAPPGPIHARAAECGVATQVMTSRLGFSRTLTGALMSGRHVVLFATRVVDSLAFSVLRRLAPGRSTHFHVIHGGSTEQDSYGRKRKLRRLDLTFVAVSDFVRGRLVAHGVPRDRVRVVENFLPPTGEATVTAATIARGLRSEARRVVIVSRLDPIKRLDLLFGALEREPRLAALKFRIYGTGQESERLAERAARHGNVELMGFDPHVRERLGWADAYLHTCPTEPFGLSILEAFEAGIPVVAPDAGGAGEIVRHERDGLQFAANDAEALAVSLVRLLESSRHERVDWAVSGRARLESRYGSERGTSDYRDLIQEVGA